MGIEKEPQKEIFTSSEGDRFYDRNKMKFETLRSSERLDPVLRMLRDIGLSYKSVLEIGCSNGWRLAALQERSSAACFGIDPSGKAVEEGMKSFPNLALRQGAADHLPYENGKFDLVIFGFCLYLCDRRDLFRIAAEADRVLADGGYMVIFDFHPPFPYRKIYAHCPGVFSYKMDYSTLFTWHPAYTHVHLEIFAETPEKCGQPDERMSVAVLRKDGQGAYPACPFGEESSD